MDAEHIYLLILGAINDSYIFKILYLVIGCINIGNNKKRGEVVIYNIYWFFYHGAR